MIVRILGEGQVDVPEDRVDHLNALDQALLERVEAGDEDGFRQALAALVAEARSAGRPVPDEVIVPSDAVLPAPDATLTEVRDLLAGTAEGLIPG